MVDEIPPVTPLPVSVVTEVSEPVVELLAVQPRLLARSLLVLVSVSEVVEVNAPVMELPLLVATTVSDADEATVSVRV